jgi:hypothetical protein
MKLYTVVGEDRSEAYESYTYVRYTTISKQDALKYIQDHIDEDHKSEHISDWGRWKEVKPPQRKTYQKNVILYEWKNDSHWHIYLASGELNGVDSLHTEYPENKEEIIKLAVSILNEDTIAQDMAKDILKI